jgi:Glycosyl hydrolases family 16
MTRRGFKLLTALAALCVAGVAIEIAVSADKPVGAPAEGGEQSAPGAIGPAAAAPSGEAMPVGDVPGWHQIFADDFTTDVALGSFPAAVSSQWTAYKSPWKDTSGYGTYSPSSVVSIAGGVLNQNIHTENGVTMVSALQPQLPSAVTYGRYAVRYRFDPIAGYKMAWMLWPDGNNNVRDGEIDFPEMNLDATTAWAFNHHTNRVNGDDQDWFKTPLTPGGWHTAVIEWSPNLVVFRFDGAEIGRTSNRVASTAMHWVLQTETQLGRGGPPAANARGNVQIDWAAVWSYDPATANAAAPTNSTYAKAGNGAIATVWPSAGQLKVSTLTAGTWTPPATAAALPNGLTVKSKTADVGVNYLGNLEAFLVASDGQVWHSYASNGASNWSPLTPLGAPTVAISGDVAVGTNNLGNQELYVKTTNGGVYHRFATPGIGSGWSGWDAMGQPAAGVRGDVSVGKNSLGNQELYIVGNDGRPYHNFATPGIGSGWNGWDPLDAPVRPVGDVSAAINYVGNQELYFAGSDGNVWHNYATPGVGSGWAGWSPLGAPAGQTMTGDITVQPRDFATLGQQWIRATATNSTVWQDTQTPGIGSGWSGWTAVH